MERCCLNSARNLIFRSSAAPHRLSCASTQSSSLRFISTFVPYTRNVSRQSSPDSTSLKALRKQPISPVHKSPVRQDRSSFRDLHTTSYYQARAPRSRPKIVEQPSRIPFGKLSHESLQRIFQYDVGHDEGNIILRIIHERRVRGSLVDLGLHIDGAPDLPQAAANNALEWLRSNYPVDEQAAAQQWTQSELQKLEKSYIDRAERLGLYKSEPDEKPESWSTADTSKSVIDEFRRYHRERREKEAQERKDSGVEQKEQELRLAKQDEASRKKEIWDARLAERKALLAKQGMVQIKGRDLEDESIPEMTKAQRLVPSTLFGISCLIAFYYMAENYTPPVQAQRLMPNVPVSVATISTIVGLNFAVFCAWRIPRLQSTMNKLLMSVPSYPYAVSMLGNTFSHQQLRHLAANMSMIILYGVSLHEDLGRGHFLALYLSGGTIGSVASLYFYVLRNKLNSWHCGASGCVWAITIAWAYLTSRKPTSSTEDYSFAMDVSRYIVATINFLYHFTPGTMSTVDVVAHGAGAVTGFVGAHLWRQQQIEPESAKEERSRKI